LYTYSISEKMERINSLQKKNVPILFNKDNLYSHFIVANVKINTDVYSPTVPHTSGSFIENKYQKKVSSAKMSDCLNAFSLPEILGKDNLWFCNKCDESVVAHKSICIYSLPKIFIVSLKRFQNNLIKLGTQVDIPLTMKLYDYSSSKEKAYELIAVIHHFGSISGGHYTCHAKLGDEWYYFNDSTATYVATKEIGTLVSNPSAYILFFREYDILNT
jgi:ubiquitin carboxyl-terminal hydrolase 4/11/15